MAPSPVDNFKTLLAAMSSVPVAVSEPVLRSVIADAASSAPGDLQKQREYVVNHLVTTTTLTDGAARPLVADALPAALADPKADPTSDTATPASTLADSTSSLIPVAVDLEMSDPVPLSPIWRGWLAVGLAGLTLACVAAISLGAAWGGFTGDTVTTLTVMGMGALVASLVLAMGYKNVTIKTGSSDTGASNGGSSSPAPTKT